MLHINFVYGVSLWNPRKRMRSKQKKRIISFPIWVFENLILPRRALTNLELIKYVRMLAYLISAEYSCATAYLSGYIQISVIIREWNTPPGLGSNSDLCLFPLIKYPECKVQLNASICRSAEAVNANRSACWLIPFVYLADLDDFRERECLWGWFKIQLTANCCLSISILWVSKISTQYSMKLTSTITPSVMALNANCFKICNKMLFLWSLILSSRSSLFKEIYLYSQGVFERGCCSRQRRM